jgi:hypothetical protein
MKKRPRRRVQKKRPRDVKIASRQHGIARPNTGAQPNTGQVRTDTKRAIADATSAASNSRRRVAAAPSAVFVTISNSKNRRSSGRW